MTIPILTPCSVLLEGGIFASHLIWRFRTRKIREIAKNDDKTFDDIAQEYEEQGIDFKFAERKRVGQAAQPTVTESDLEPSTQSVSLTILKEFPALWSLLEPQKRHRDLLTNSQRDAKDSIGSFG